MDNNNLEYLWLSPQDAAKALGITKRTLRKYAMQNKIEKKISVDKTGKNGRSLYKVAKSSVKTVPVPATLTPAEKTQKTKTHNAAIEKYFEQLSSFTPSGNYKQPKSNSIPVIDRTLCILLSDTHFGKKTNFGFSSFTAAHCVQSILHKIDDLYIDMDDIGEVLLILAGDMVEGEDIYGTQAHHIDKPVIDQVQDFTKIIWQLILDIHAKYKVNVRVETCYGNHGRISKTADEKSNWDNIIYYYLDLAASSLQKPYIKVNANYKPFHIIDVQDKKCLITHHAVKHTESSSMKAKLASWNHVNTYDFICHGHWHSWGIGSIFGKLIIRNGSLTGYDDLAEKIGVYDPPRQGWFIVEKGQPISTIGFFEFNHANYK